MFQKEKFLFLALAFSLAATAGQINYVVTGTASGTIGGIPFTNALVQVTATADTANVVSLSLEGYEVFANVASSTTVMIAGIGTATVTGGAEPGVSPNPVGVFSFPSPIPIDSQFPVLPYVVIGTLDNPPTLNSFTGIGLIGSNALLGYDLRTSIGPITAIPGGVNYSEGLFVYTTLGNLTFTQNHSPTGQGTFAASAAVPEPASLLLTAIGLCAVAGTHWLRRSASAQNAGASGHR
ncbi:MAG: PEP-CTERM sorting domain-containing protein [Bryobacteraceae bacterium]|nr:PEP-CTERM sorting domain-containing protein [Bryobacteraceae bacterium]